MQIVPEINSGICHIILKRHKSINFIEKIMSKASRFFITIIIALFCTVTIFFGLMQSSPANNLKQSPISTLQNIDFSRHFQNLGVEGSILIYDSNKDRTYQHNPQRNAKQFLPASTFKILNSLIALDKKVIADEKAILTWDGIERQIPEWNRDLNMREAIKLSAVWFYQVLARRVGHEHMQKMVAQVSYGNQTIGGKEDIDKFWLEGKLRITPQQQIQFLRRFAKNDLPFSGKTISVVKDIITTKKTPEHTMYGKTGLVGQIGWHVGYLEQGKNTYFFATNIEIRNKKDAASRVELTRLCLKDLALL
jgi:beta-lactamase class D